ncbi:hypothetical protein QJS83_11420 [Bdellovibrio sp. 22V]|uniref:hypothetical protein n=1 Tax=Bdellovibrio TaxID=958 RepID=UPI0025427809|nr:hypothetical protein [Bdellovibrio sp. 22V]WII71071.1 hypothetical protein QJS83_11420 [Bdellovibrio sp. 22V]
MKKLLLTSIILLAVLGCSSGSDDSGNPGQPGNNKPDTSLDEASVEERNLITENLDLIKRYAAEFSADIDLSRIPIVVTSKPNLIEPLKSSSCVQDGGNARITLQKSFFTQRVYERDTGFASPLFNLLIHEIGHCYFNRDHEAIVLRKEGYKAQFSVETAQGVRTVSYPSIQATMMHNVYMPIPHLLEKYYVGEILGRWRAKTLDELREKYGFDLVRD